MQAGDDKQVLIFAGGGLGHVSGGVGTLLGYLIAAWARDPHSLPVRVIDTRGAGGAVSAAVYFICALGALVMRCARRQVACVHINMTTRGSAVRKTLLCMTARLLRTPIVLHLHGADFFDFYASLPVWARGILRANMRAVDCTIVIGAVWRQRLIRELGVVPDRIRVVPNGVPAAARAAMSGGTPRILFLGRLGARKGVADLIAALGCPAMMLRAWTAIIAGDGDGEPYRAQINMSGLHPRVTMPGWLDAAATANALATADILVLPSYHEVMPIAILEAMARGLAIVATPVGAIPEILQDGVSARLVHAGDPASLALALAELVDRPALRREFGDAALQIFRSRLDIGLAAASVQAIYRDIGGTQPAARPARPVPA